MCGILARFGDDAPLALRLLSERGPHGAATWRDGSMLLALARLAIVAPRAKARVDVHGDVAAVMNGELYEHRSLGLEEGASDQALVPRMISRLGLAAFKDVHGPVTAAIANQRERTLTLVRDRFGKRPLFVDVEGRCAASEQKALIALRGAPLQFSRTAVSRYLTRGFLEDDAPLVSGLESVPPGAAWVLHEDGRLERGPPSSSSSSSSSRTLDSELLREACARRLDGLEVGAALAFSGGLDSSVLAALSPGVPAYTMRVRSSAEHDESEHARVTAKALGLEHHVVDIEPPTLADLAACAWRLEVPDAFVGFGLAHAYGTLARRLRDDGVRVVVTGEGADELFLGYPWHRAQAAAQNGWPLPADVSERAWAGASLSTPRGGRALEVYLRARFGDPLQGRDPLSLLRKEVLADDDAPPTVPDEGSERGAERRRADSLRIDLPMWPLRIADRMLMGHGVEPRAPFLDDDVVAAALASPAFTQESPREDKPHLRAIARKLLPAEPRAKQGFGAWSWPGAATTRSWAAQLAKDGSLLVRADVLHELSALSDDTSALLAWRLVVLEVTARQLDAARAGEPWRP